MTGTQGAVDGVADPAGPADHALTRAIDAIEQLPADLSPADTVAALAALRRLRVRLDLLEPRLIAAARSQGASWAELAPVLGVASRQAAERRFLRMRVADQEASAATRESRVRAERDRRAGDRAVDRWARDHGADLRQLAGQITALTDLDTRAGPDVARLHRALGAAGVTDLVDSLVEVADHLRAGHVGLAERVDTVRQETDQVRHLTQRHRDATRAESDEPDRR
jgi:hypothetical protein